MYFGARIGRNKQFKIVLTVSQPDRSRLTKDQIVQPLFLAVRTRRNRAPASELSIWHCGDRRLYVCGHQAERSLMPERPHYTAHRCSRPFGRGPDYAGVIGRAMRPRRG